MSLVRNERQNELTCKPIVNYKDIMSFLQNPPPWRSLCIELKRHSEYGLKNIHIKENIRETPEEIEKESYQAFCHFNPDTEKNIRYEIKKLPKTLVCHDMANGYHDDSVACVRSGCKNNKSSAFLLVRFVKGEKRHIRERAAAFLAISTCPKLLRQSGHQACFIDGTGAFDAYTFYNWSGIDIFCYFSHHFITIPPLGWINAAHAHGVKIIGTLITEWTDGEVLWDYILSSEEEWKNFVSMLVALAKTMKFDGWLLNIENKVKKPTELVRFVRYLHETLHQELSDPELIWYDSVTIEGLLIWQNGLNQKNKAFFDACDGIFTNYSWRERDVESSAHAAGDRLTDVYVGIDVWGRNFYGGGQFNTRKAVEIPHKHGCSLAIFAFAWTHEAIPHHDDTISEALDTYQQFLIRDRAFWGSIWPYLNTKLPSELPFQTSFCRGQGKKRRRYGEILDPEPWYNLRHMQYQPNSNHGPHGYMLSTFDAIMDVAHNLKLEETLEYPEAFQHIDANDALDVNQESEETNMKTMTDKIKSLFRIVSSNKNKKCADKSKQIKSHSFVLQLTKNLKLDVTAGDTDIALVKIPGDKECLEVYLEDSFTGGSCLKVNPSDGFLEDYRLIRLFHCDFLIKDSLISSVVTKALPGHEEQSLNVQLSVVTSSGSCMNVLLKSCGTLNDEDPNGLLNVYPVNESQSASFKELQKHLLINEPGFYVPTENAYGWKVKYYIVHLPGATVVSINCQTELARSPILLGHIGLTSWIS